MKMGKVNLTDILVRRYSSDVPKTFCKKSLVRSAGSLESIFSGSRRCGDCYLMSSQY